MLASNPSADSVASTDRGGKLRHPFSVKCGARVPASDRHQSDKSWGRGAKPSPLGTARALSSRHMAGTLSFSIAMQRHGTASLPQVAAAV